MSAEGPVKALEVRDAEEIASFYGVPKQLVNMFVVVFGETAYPKEAMLLYLGHRKGIQAIDVTEPAKGGDGEWRCRATIYPRVGPDSLRELAKFTKEERGEMWTHLSRPTSQEGHASERNVRMSTMHQWLPEIAIKRAVCRALRLFAGVGLTSFEELPAVEISREEANEARSMVARRGRVADAQTPQGKLVAD